jgi:hypothetical protein
MFFVTFFTLSDCYSKNYVYLCSDMTEKQVKIPFGCPDCKHFKGGLGCKAFDVIPLEIFDAPESHTEPIDGQQGNFVFEPAHEPETMRVYEATPATA